MSMPNPYTLPGWQPSTTQGTWWPATHGHALLPGVHFPTHAACLRWCDDYNHNLPHTDPGRVAPVMLPFTTQADHG